MRSDVAVESYPRPTRRRRRGRRIGRWIVAIVLLAVIAAVAFVVTRPHPEVAVRGLVDGIKAGDQAEVEKHLTEENLQLLSMPGARRLFPVALAAMRSYLMKKDFVEGEQYTIEVKSVKKEKAVVSLKAGPKLQDSSIPARILKSLDEGIPFIVVKEKDAWKVDLVATYPSLIGPLQRQGIDLGHVGAEGIQK